MKITSAYEITESGRVQLLQRSFPELGPDYFLVGRHRIGVCATDLHLLDGDLGVGYPLIPEHEFIGEVAEIDCTASRHRRLSEGNYVAVEVPLSCYERNKCRRGRYKLDELDDRSVAAIDRQHGINIPADSPPGLWGGSCEYDFAPQEAIVHRTPDQLSRERTALVESLAIAFRAVDRASVGPGHPLRSIRT